MVVEREHTVSTIRAELPRISLRRGPAAATIVHAIAKTVVVSGLVLVGFLAYQFGVTTYFANQAQDDLRGQLATAAARVTVIPYLERNRSPAPIVIPPGLPVAPIAAATATITVETAPAAGEPVGRLVIPEAGVDWVFVEGVDRAALRSGAGHMPGTALPGQPGNAVISGHRTTHGAPFLHLDRLEPGDVITVESASGEHVYQVVETLIVAPGDTWVTGQWDGAWLTLTTCDPVFSAQRRLVVIARLIGGPNAGVILGSR